MRLTRAVVALLLCFGGSSVAAQTVYIDAVIEMPLETLQTHFATLEDEGCYRIGEDRYLLITMDAEERKPWRVAMASSPPCSRPETAPPLDLRERTGVALGDSSAAVVERLGRPELASRPEPALRRLGEREYFYVCRVEEFCARHTSIFIRDGVVSAIAQWYSE